MFDATSFDVNRYAMQRSDANASVKSPSAARLSSNLMICANSACSAAGASASGGSTNTAKYFRSMPISGSDLVVWKHQFYRQIGSNPISIGTALMEVSDAA